MAVDFENLEKFAKQNNVPIVRPTTLEYLLDCVRKNAPSTILEIGTAIGYSGAKMLSVCDAKLVTIEKNLDMYMLAKQNFEKQNLTHRVECILGDAAEKLDSIEKSGRKFDFVFLDGPKGQYVKYLPNIVSLLNVGGIIFADNVLFRGMVNSVGPVPHKNRTIVQNLRAYLRCVQESQFESQIFDIEDGFCITKKLSD